MIDSHNQNEDDGMMVNDLLEIFLNKLGRLIVLDLSSFKRMALDKTGKDVDFYKLQKLARMGLVENAGPLPGRYTLSSTGYTFARDLWLAKFSGQLPHPNMVWCLFKLKDGSKSVEELALSTFGGMIDNEIALTLAMEALLRHNIVNFEEDKYKLSEFGEWLVCGLSPPTFEVPTTSLELLNDIELKPRTIANKFRPVELSYLLLDLLESSGLAKRDNKNNLVRNW